MRIALLALTLLATWWSSLSAVDVPVAEVDRGAVGITNGTTDFLPLASTTVTYTISNTGDIPLGVNQVNISEEIGATVVITTPPASVVAAGGSTTLVLGITPGGSVTSWSFRITFGTTDLDNNPFTWLVKSGTARPEITVTYHGVDLPDGSTGANAIRVGSADYVPVPSVSLYYFTVRNIGTANLNISSIQVSTAAAPVFVGDGLADLALLNPVVFPAVVAPGDTLNVIIDARVTSALVTNWRGSVIINSDDGEANSAERAYAFTIYGDVETMGSFGTLGDGEVRVTGPLNPPVILLNNGIARTTPGSSRVGVATDYVLTVHNMHTGDSLRILYPITSAPGVTPKTFGAAAIVVPKSVTDAGPINATATIPNAIPTGTNALNPPGIIADNGDTGWITVGPWPVPFPPLTTTITVRVTPTKEGAWSVPVRFRSNDSGTGTLEDPCTITLTGVALGVPDISATNRGTTRTTSGTIATNIVSAPGFTNLHSIVVRNTGSGTVLLSDTVVVSGLVNCTLVGTPTVDRTSIGPNGTATYSVNTVPTALGAWSANISITSTDETPNPLVVTVSGTATPPAPELDILQGSTVIADAGTASTNKSLVGKNNSYTFVLRNSGTGTLTITGASVTGTLNCTANLVQPAAFPVTVLAQDPPLSTSLVFTVNPAAKGPWSVDVTVLSDDGDENPYTFTFTGTAVKLKPQDDCGIGTGFSFLLLLLVGGLVPLVRRRR